MDSIEISRAYGSVFDDASKACVRTQEHASGARSCSNLCGEAEDVPLLDRIYWPLTLGMVYFFAALILGLAAMA